MNDRSKPIVDEIAAAARSRHIADVFSDAVHCMACSIYGTVALGKTKEANEEDFAAHRARFNDEEWNHVCAAFARVMEALEERREDILGHVLEVIGATNVRSGQFLTPVCVARMLGEMTVKEPAHRVERLNDPACGAGVLLIEGAEAMLRKGWSQANILIDAGDLDGRACDMTYVQFSLLGYAAVVRHQDALSRKYFYPSPIRYTPGWYLHGFPMRGITEAGERHNTLADEDAPPPPPPPPPPKAQEAAPTAKAEPVQMELF